MTTGNRIAATLMSAVLAIVAPSGARADAPLVTFAAASLSNAFEDIGKAWSARGGVPVRFSFAASSTLAKQIEQGAPATIFASADEAWMNHLAERKLIDPATRRNLATNRLVIVVPADRNDIVDLRPGVDFMRILAGGRIATGDPAHVPVGRYAQEALTRLGAWDVVAPRLVRAESVRAALAFVERGEAAAGIVYSTDAALSRRVRVAGMFPQDTHAPIVYPIAIVAGKPGESARGFYDFVSGTEARTILRRYGFGEP